MQRAVIAVVLVLAGCSLGTTPQPDACTSSDECRAAFGAVFSCNVDTGLCESSESAVCPELFPASARTDPSAIVFGTIFDRSSPNQLAREKSARLAVEGINRAGGIDGRPVMLVHCDTSLGSALDAADFLVDRVNVPAIIGPSSSSDTEAVFTSHDADGVLVISPSATATQLEDIDTNMPGRLWRTAPPDTLQSTVIMADIVGIGTTSLVIVRRANDVYAQSLSVLLQEAAMMMSGLALGTSQVFRDEAAIEGAATMAIATSPDVVFFVSSVVADAATFLDATSSISGYDGTTIYFPDAAANEDLFTLTTTGSTRFPQVRATRPAAPNTIITSEFVSEYMSANGGEDPRQFSFTAHTYDAAALVLLGAGFALRDRGELTGTRIAQGIKLMSQGSIEHQLLGTSFTRTIAALRGVAPDVDVVGASGPLDYDAITEELTSATYEVLEIAGDPPSFEVLATVDAPP